jgi:hypothetical protein
MNRRLLLTLALSATAALASGVAGATGAADGYRLSGPHVHANLAIYFVHGKSAPGPAPLTLQEAMAKGAVLVHETGSVNELAIENLSGDEVFVQSGDIVKGGKQDRVLMVSLLLPPKSGRLPIASFCVEQGRWSPRGREEAGRFASAEAALPSRKAKMAMRAPMPAGTAELAQPQTAPLDRLGRIGGQRILPHFNPQAGRGNDTGSRQQQVWASVADTQQKLSGALGQAVAAPQSRSSLQLSLENDKLKETQAAYMAALKAGGEQGDDIVGYVFAINGKLNSADLYPSNALFRKMWGKLLSASVTEAIGDRGEAAAGSPPPTEAVRAFLTAAEHGAPQTAAAAPKPVNGVRLETREAETALYFAAERVGGGFVHRNYLAK